MKRKKLKRGINISHGIKKRQRQVDTKLVIVLVIVGIFAVLIGVSQFISNEQDGLDLQNQDVRTTTTVLKPLTCEENCKTDAVCMNNCKIAEVNRIVAKEGSNVNDCSKIKDAEAKGICQNNFIFKEASAKSDSAICDKISDQIKRDNCKDNIIIDKALFSRDKSICNQIQNIETRELCKENIR